MISCAGDCLRPTAAVRLAAGLIALLLSWLPPVAGAINYGGIGGRPAFPRSENPRTDDIFVHTLSPGASAPEGFFVINSTEEAKTVYVYSADFTPSSDGGFACEQLSASNQGASATKQGVGAWIVFGRPQPPQPVEAALPADVTAASLSIPAPAAIDDQSDEDGDGLTAQREVQLGTNPSLADSDADGYSDQQELASGYDPLQPMVLTLEPQTKVLVPFTLSVPATADVGEHNGCLLVQEKNPPVNDGQGVNIATRTGLRVAVTVPGGISRKLAIAGFEVQPRVRGGKILRPGVRNEGNVSVDADVRVETKNLFGQVAMRHGGQYAILRGQTNVWNFEFPQTFWGGWYATTLTVAYNPNPSVELGADGERSQVLAGPILWFFLWPSLQAFGIIGVALCFVLLAVFLFLLRHRRKSIIRRTWVPYTVLPGDTVQGLAGRYGVSWRILADANRLKPPYHLELGTALRVPPTSRH